jgi:hypothetical protein
LYTYEREKPSGDITLLTMGRCVTVLKDVLDSRVEGIRALISSMTEPSNERSEGGEETDAIESRAARELEMKERRTAEATRIVERMREDAKRRV